MSFASAAPRIVGSVALVAVATGCATLHDSGPLRTVRLDAGARDRCLVVLLPGRGSEPESFADAGFADAVERRGLPLDLVAVDAHMGYYRDRSVIERLKREVIDPAKLAGYDEIWIAGTSLGGLGGLLYLRDHPADLAGVVALAPFLGKPALVREIVDAGGPAAWRSPAEGRDHDVGRELWTWLAPRATSSPTIPLHLGWGTDDAFDLACRTLAAALPAEQAYTLPGGHDWRVWARLWGEILDRAALCRTGS